MAKHALHRDRPKAEIRARIYPDGQERKRLQDDRASRKREMSDAEKAAIVIKSWNAFFRGEPIGALKWQNAGPRREDFPIIDGLDATTAGRDNVSEAA